MRVSDNILQQKNTSNTARSLLMLENTPWHPENFMGHVFFEFPLKAKPNSQQAAQKPKRPQKPESSLSSLCKQTKLLAAQKPPRACGPVAQVLYKQPAPLYQLARLAAQDAAIPQQQAHSLVFEGSSQEIRPASPLKLKAVSLRGSKVQSLQIRGQKAPRLQLKPKMKGKLPSWSKRFHAFGRKRATKSPRSFPAASGFELSRAKRRAGACQKPLRLAT